MNTISRWRCEKFALPSWRRTFTFKVVKEFVSRVKEKALGEEVLRNLMPGQQGCEDRS